MKQLNTTVPDESGELLAELMQGLGKIALCEYHQLQRIYYAQEGRSEDWEAGRP